MIELQECDGQTLRVAPDAIIAIEAGRHYDNWRSRITLETGKAFALNDWPSDVQAKIDAAMTVNKVGDHEA